MNNAFDEIQQSAKALKIDIYATPIFTLYIFPSFYPLLSHTLLIINKLSPQPLLILSHYPN